MSEPYIRFTRVYGETRVVVRLHGDASLDEICAEFEAFLRGCGYSFGSVQIVEDDD